MKTIDPNLLKSKYESSSHCVEDIIIHSDFASGYNEQITFLESNIGKAEAYLQYIKAYFKGIICTICDKSQQQYFDKSRTDEKF